MYQIKLKPGEYLDTTSNTISSRFYQQDRTASEILSHIASNISDIEIEGIARALKIIT